MSRAPAARCARVVQIRFAHREEGAGNAGCALHPRSRVQKCTKENAHEHTGTVGAFRRPCAMALRLMPRSPRRRIRLVTVADGLKDCQNPVGSTPLRQLDTSNGCQNHTVLPYALAPVVRALRSLTDQGPPFEHDHAPDAAASTASRPTFVTMANAPSRDR